MTEIDLASNAIRKVGDEVDVTKCLKIVSVVLKILKC